MALAACYLYEIPVAAATERARARGLFRAIVDRFASQRDLYRKYYSFYLLTSREARARWIPLDSEP